MSVISPGPVSNTPLFLSQTFLFIAQIEAAKSLNMLKICIISFGAGF